MPGTVTIDEALDAGLAEQRERLSPKTLCDYEDVEGGIGPVRVSKKASDLAAVGWSVNIVLAQLRGGWRIVELGFVYR